MKLQSDDKFFIQNDDGDLILVTEIDFDFRVTQNGIIPMKGILFQVDYLENSIDPPKPVSIQASFSIDAIWEED